MNSGPETGSAPEEPRVRPLEARDLDDVVALDRKIAGRGRRGYFEKRLASALRSPETHIQVAAERDGVLIGFALARVLRGEFGRTDPAVLIEAITVDPGCQRRGIGRRLIAAIEDVMRRKGIRKMKTQAAWTDHEVLRFLDSLGFEMAPRQIVECSVEQAARL